MVEEPGERGVEELRLLEVRQMAGAWDHCQLGTGDTGVHLLRVRGWRQCVLIADNDESGNVDR